ncbi:XAP5, circadian clock regulator-domain-containing protein [Tuber indicum]|nr:XAP5, circadian clock regulator-domain-containing protein [Tuber indicum]
MADPTTSTPSCFAASTETLGDVLKTQTAGFKRRIELAEQRDREEAEKLLPIRSGGGGGPVSSTRGGSKAPPVAADINESGEEGEVKKWKVNPKLGLPAPKVLTKNTLLREPQGCETLRREFLPLQKIKNEEISIPFVFYDGTNVAPPTGEGVTVRKGEAVWLLLEHARRMAGRREWLRVSRFEFYYFIVNNTMGPHGLLFGFSSSPSPAFRTCAQNPNRDPTYERSKHIFPASVWTEFDPNTDYSSMVRRDMGGNVFPFG